MFGQHDHHDEDKKDEEHMVHSSDNPAPSDNSSSGTWHHPGVPLNGSHDAGSLQDDNNGAATAVHDGSQTVGGAAPANDDTHNEYSGFSGHSNDQASTDDDAGDDSSDTDEDLADLKLQALSKLSPLVDHLEQSPEEKFRTLMMMIQASDDQSLIKQAYQTSLSIGDEKERAQALLDIVNEINYFTQYPASNQ
ncbi:MAG TPA: hypothetical protein VHB72_00080 [Candidatus Saccharimonadales bacterium]|nr:hypothetical protein [Candidatus Saccharimonadales bacterium]